MSPLEAVTIVEVGPRDGLQNEPLFFPTEDKIKLVDLLSGSGLSRIEVTSFVHPRAIPQLRDVVEVLGGIQRQEGVRYSVLVPNKRGCERALEANVDEWALFVSASETHNRKNVNMSVEESLKALREVADMATGTGPGLRGYVITAFGCPYEGAVSDEQVRKILNAYAEMGVAEVSLGDTTGMANPVQVAKMLDWVLKDTTTMAVAVHFHDSRGTGLANALAAYQAGARIFDSSVGGIGGCPAAEGAMGNIATEDLVNMMEEMGISTGIHFDRLMEAAAFAQSVIGTDLPSHTLKVGRPDWFGGRP